MPGRKLYSTRKAWVIRSLCNGCQKPLSQQLPPTQMKMVKFWQWRADAKGHCPECAERIARENAEKETEPTPVSPSSSNLGLTAGAAATTTEESPSA